VATFKHFAYGSNMCACWLKRDIDSAVFLYRAELKGWRLVFNKKSEDGSAKANIEESPGDSVLGVVYEIDESERGLLDGKEGKYEPLTVSATLEGGSSEDAVTYKSDHKTGEPPYEWYLKLIIGGAKEHGLRKEYIKTLENIETKPIPVNN
jgi:gamma-glutamylcyclotransferase